MSKGIRECLCLCFFVCIGCIYAAQDSFPSPQNQKFILDEERRGVAEEYLPLGDVKKRGVLHTVTKHGGDAATLLDTAQTDESELQDAYGYGAGVVGGGRPHLRYRQQYDDLADKQPYAHPSILGTSKLGAFGGLKGPTHQHFPATEYGYYGGGGGGAAHEGLGAYAGLPSYGHSATAPGYEAGDYAKTSIIKKVLIPIAGIALLGAAVALTANPVLLQLGAISGRRRRRQALYVEDVFPTNEFVKPKTLKRKLFPAKHKSSSRDN